MYKLKHTPTGMYYQPHKHRGSNLSKRGKIYQTSTHGLSSAFKRYELFPNENKFSVYCQKDSVVHRQSCGVLDWKESRWLSVGQLSAETNVSDWVIENI